MSKKLRGAIPHAPRAGGYRPLPALPPALVREILALTEAGQWEQLEARAQVTVSRFPTHPLGWKLLGAARIQRGSYAEALPALAKTTRLAPDDAGAHNDLGVALAGLGRAEEATQSYERALKADPRHAQAHSNLGLLLSQIGHFDTALVHAQQAIQFQPLAADSHNNLGTVYRDLTRHAEAEAAYQRAIALNPRHLQAWVNLAQTCNDLEKFADAQAAYRQALALQADSLPALLGLGGLLRRFGSKQEAISCLERCIALAPDGMEAHVELGNVHLDLKDSERSSALFRTAQRLQPLISWTAKKARPDFSVVLLDTPGASCTPIDYLAGIAPYDRHFYCVTREPSPHLELLRTKADVVFNLIADADNGAEILPFAAALADSIGRPVVNHPRQVMNSSRDGAARLLQGIDLCRVPKTLRFSASALLSAANGPLLDGLNWPLLARPTGKHGGDEFEKFDTPQAVADFAAARPDADIYLSEFVDYRSADGFHRKYRFIVVDGELFAYHLAIHDHWKVHHFRTDMAHQPWMRDEEQRFLATPEQVFDPPRLDALRRIAAAIGLDYCGLDVALGSDRRIVLFEANAAMLVHDEKGDTFAYKNSYIVRIKQAVDAMLARRAGHAPALVGQTS